MLVRDKNGNLHEIMRCNFTSDRSYYIKIMQLKGIYKRSKSVEDLQSLIS